MHAAQQLAQAPLERRVAARAAEPARSRGNPAAWRRRSAPPRVALRRHRLLLHRLQEIAERMLGHRRRASRRPAPPRTSRRGAARGHRRCSRSRHVARPRRAPCSLSHIIARPRTSRTSVSTQPAILQQQRPVGAAASDRLCVTTTIADLEVPRQLREQLVQPLARSRDRDCPTARRPAAPRDRPPARAPPPCAAARRPTARRAVMHATAQPDARRAAPRRAAPRLRIRSPAIRSGIITFSSAVNSRSR